MVVLEIDTLCLKSNSVASWLCDHGEVMSLFDLQSGYL
jgi:hypothetical protein